MKLTFKDCMLLTGSAFALYLGIHYWQALANLVKLVLGAAVPLIVGCVIAYVVNILMRFYERIWPDGKTGSTAGKLRRPVCMIAAFLTLIAIVALIVYLVLPQLTEAVRVIAAAFPGFMEKALALAEEWGLLSEEVLAPLSDIDWKNALSQIFDVVKSGIGNVMDVVVSTVSSLFSGVVTALVALIFSIYLLMGKEHLGAQFHRMAGHYLPKRWYETVRYLMWVVDDCFHRYIVGQCIEAVILGTLCAVGMALLRLPYATMIGVLVAFTALIPVAGAYIGAGVGAFMILTVDPFKAVIFLVFLVVLQQFEGNVIYPRVVGSSMGLPGIWVLTAVTVGGGILGIAGMLLGVPLMAALYRILRDDVRGRAWKLPEAEDAVPPASDACAPEVPAEE